MDINEKRAIEYLLYVLSANMLNDEDAKKFEEETYMLLNPMDRYCEAKGRKEGKIEGIKEGKLEGIKEGKIEGKMEGKLETAMNMLDDGFPIEKVIQLTGLSEADIMNAK